MGHMMHCIWFGSPLPLHLGSDKVTSVGVHSICAFMVKVSLEKK